MTRTDEIRVYTIVAAVCGSVSAVIVIPAILFLIFRKRFEIKFLKLSAFLSIVIGLLLELWLIFVIAVPWYQQKFSVQVTETDQTAISRCTIRVARGWSIQYCWTDDDCDNYEQKFSNNASNTTVFDPKNFCYHNFKKNWRSNAPSRTLVLFDVAYALTLVSLVCAVPLTLGFVLVRENETDDEQRAMFYPKLCWELFGLIGVICLGIAIIWFPAAWPDYIPHSSCINYSDSVMRNIVDSLATTGPCSSWMGHKQGSLTIENLVVNYNWEWGGAPGYWVGFGLWFFFAGLCGYSWFVGI